MNLLPTQVDPQSERFRANAEAMQAAVDQLHADLRQAREEGEKSTQPAI